MKKNIESNKEKLSLYESLIKLDLQVTSAKIYEYLFINGESSATKISKNLNIKRSSVYDYLKELKKSGLILEKELESKTYFQAEDIEIVIDKLKDKELSIKMHLDNIIENKNKFKNLEKKKAVKIRFYEGVKGLHSTLDSILFLENKEIYSFWPYEAMLKNCGPEYLKIFNNKRIAKNKKLDVIWTDYKKTFVKNEAKSIWESDKYVNKKLFPIKNKNTLNIGYVICGDVVAFLSATDDVYGYVINSKEHSDMMRHHFSMDWSSI